MTVSSGNRAGAKSLYYWGPRLRGLAPAVGKWRSKLQGLAPAVENRSSVLFPNFAIDCFKISRIAGNIVPNTDVEPVELHLMIETDFLARCGHGEAAPS